MLDEIEKAHSDVFNILLQVLDDGRLTDGQGRTVDFRNTVIIMTSNLGSDLIMESAGIEHYEELKQKITNVISDYFRPEFLNRIDETVIFHSLEKDHVKSIASIQLKQLTNRLKDNGLLFDYTEASLSIIAEKGFDPVYGARPLKRAIQQWIENPLAQKILAGDLKHDKVILLDAQNGVLVFR